MIQITNNNWPISVSVFTLALPTRISLEINACYVDLVVITALPILVSTVMQISTVIRTNAIKIAILLVYNLITVNLMVKKCVYCVLMAVINVKV